MKVAVISVVMTGRRMQSSDKFMFTILPCTSRADTAVPSLQQKLTLGHDGLAAVEAALEHGLSRQTVRATLTG